MKHRITPGAKVIRSIYIEEEVINNLSELAAILGMTETTFMRYAITICTKEETLPQRVLTAYQMDRARALDNRAESKKAFEKSEKKLIRKTLKLCKGNKTQAAKELNMARATLISKMDNYGIRRNAYGGRDE